MQEAITKNEADASLQTMKNLDLLFGKKQTISGKCMENGFILFLTFYVSKEVFKNT